jgi:hypothetical protein
VASNASGSATSTTATLTYTGNVAPVANDDTVTRLSGFTVKVKPSTVLANDTDADGDAVSLSGVQSTTTNGAAVSYDGTNIFIGAATVVDAVTYTNADAFGGSGMGLIILNPTATASGQVTSVTNAGGSVIANFAGVPTFSYTVQRATNVDFTVGVVVDLITTSAPAGGLFNTTDTFSDLGGTPPTEAYYRLKYNP